jgi:hypothetical protein
MKMKVESCGGCDWRSSPNRETRRAGEGEEGVRVRCARSSAPCAALRR